MAERLKPVTAPPPPDQAVAPLTTPEDRAAGFTRSQLGRTRIAPAIKSENDRALSDGDPFTELDDRGH